MLELKNINFSYEKNTILAGLNLTLKQGEFAYLIGKSGTGKSTLLKLIYMNIFPDEGEVLFKQYSSLLVSRKDLTQLRRKLGIVFQDFKLLEDRNVFHNLSFILEVTGKSKKVIAKKVLSVLAEVGLSERGKSFPNELSGGERQRVAIARAIINEPDLIIADEPTGNLDPETSKDILSLFKKINEKGTAILLATHNYDLIRMDQNSDKPPKIIMLENGKAKQVIVKQ